jgi:hypothetical protein
VACSGAARITRASAASLWISLSDGATRWKKTMRSAALTAPRPITAWRSGARSTRAAMPAAAARNSSDHMMVRVRAPPYCDVQRAMTTMGRIARDRDDRAMRRRG